MVRQPTKRRCSCVLALNYTFIRVYWWTRQGIHNTLIVVYRYLRLMGDKTIPDSAKPRLESFCPPFVTGIDLPHQRVVDSYNPSLGMRQVFWWRHNGLVTSQSTDPTKWPNYPLKLITIYVQINTHNTESLTQRCRRSTNAQLCFIFLYITIWFES